MRRKLVMLATAMMILVLAAPAGADTWTGYASGSVSSSNPNFGLTANLDITPFDSNLGTLNSVTMSAEVNVSGSASLWSSDDFATLSVNFKNTLAAVTEMGWGPTVASFADSTPLWYYDYDFGEGYAQLDGSGNNVAYNMITTDFGRFAGPDPFQIALQLSGLVSSTGASLYGSPVFSYDGNATVSYEYDYTPGTSTAVPEPATMLLFGFGLVGLAGLRRFKK